MELDDFLTGELDADKKAYLTAVWRIVHEIDYGRNNILSISRLGLKDCPPLPDGIHELECDNNQLVKLPRLPLRLEYLDCQNNELTSLPVLPSTLSELFCSRNQLTELPELPASLKALSCHNNQLTKLPNLPSELEGLSCGYNQLTKLPKLPQSLDYFHCSGNPFIEPFDSFVQRYEETLNIDELRKSIDKYYETLPKVRNYYSLRNSLVKQGALPNNALSRISSLLTGKPGNLNAQTAALKRNAGLPPTRGGKRKTRKNRKSRQRKSRRYH